MLASRIAWLRSSTCLLAASVLALSACTGDQPTAAPDDEPVEEPGDDADDDEGTEDDPGPTEPEPRECTLEGPASALADLTGDDPVAVAQAVADVTHACADIVVVAASDPAWAAALAAPVAAAAGGPLLLAPADDPAAVAETLVALEPREVVTIGFAQDPTGALDLGDVPVHAVPAQPSADAGATDADTTDDDVVDEEPAGSDDGGLALAVGVAEHLDVNRALGFAASDMGSLAAALSRAAEGLPLLPLPSEEAALQEAATALPPTLQVETIARDEEAAQALADRLLGLGVDAEASTRPRFATDASEVAWLADPQDGTGYAVAAAAAGGRGEVLLPIHGDAPWREAGRTDRLREVAPAHIGLVGAADIEAARWQLPTVMSSEPLPTGAYTLFETERMVALYGVPGSRSLGVLGEQDLDGTVARVREVAEPYGADGRTVLPTFEIITTVASASAGERGDYSNWADPDAIRPWADRAADEGFYVVLDLQPGRTDFLTQAQEYEDLLREPHVGLALDPEWRLEDDEVHLRQIGSVAADEVQQVADWLAGLVRQHHLPQKLLLLHQFRLSMLPDRDTIDIGPELAAVVHMDGQGAIGSKYATYDAITAGAEDRWWWGWKNFYDEDFPTPTPEEVLALDPLPVYVSYQ